MRKFLLLAVAAAGFSSSSLARTEAETAARRIEADMAFLADDARLGREAGSKAYDAAARFAARRMKSVGLAPADGKNWRQKVRLRAAVRDAGAARFVVADGGLLGPVYKVIDARIDT